MDEKVEIATTDIEGRTRLYDEVEAIQGKRTEKLLLENPGLVRAGNIRIQERVTGSSRGILIYPGGLDRHTDEGTFRIFGENRGISVFQVRYPYGSGFSLRKEVAEALDHIEARGVREIDILTGSYGGIPALLTIYTVLAEEPQLNVRSFLALKAALQPSDLNTLMMRAGRLIARPLLQIKRNTPFRQLSARANAQDIPYPNEDVLEKVAHVPALFVLPPHGRDIALRDTNYFRYFPNAQIFMDSYPYNRRELRSSALGHDSLLLEPEIRDLQKQFLEKPSETILLPPDKFKRIK